MVKKSYISVALGLLDLEGANAILSGSISETKIVASSEDLSVSDFKEDDTFQDSGFGDISF